MYIVFNGPFPVTIMNIFGNPPRPPSLSLVAVRSYMAKALINMPKSSSAVQDVLDNNKAVLSGRKDGMWIFWIVDFGESDNSKGGDLGERIFGESVA